MNTLAALQILVEAGSQIDSQWSMYIVVHLGLFWFFFLVHRPLLSVERTIALAAYAGFAFINGNALRHTYQFIEAIRTDLTTRFADELARAPATAKALASINYADREQLIFMTHGAAFLVVALFLLFRNSMISRYEQLFPRYAQSGRGGLLG